MKKLTWIVIVIVFLFIVGKVFINYLSTANCPPPEKPKNVPSIAVWKGGCDGGHWVELVSVKKDTLRFKIYRDWNGDLLLDTDFKYDSCNTFRLTESNWKEHVVYFGDALEIYEKSNAGKCRLIPIYPAYDENTVE